MKMLLKALAVLLLIPVAIALLVGGYYGFVPGVSAVFGSNKPRDLGIRQTAQDYESAAAKSDIDFLYKPSTGSPAGSIVFGGAVAIDDGFTGAELTALLANDQWEYNFLRDTQIRINADGTQELAGILLVDRVPGFLAARGYSPEAMKKIGDMLKYIPTNPAFYVKLDAGWQDNVLDMSLREAQIGRLSANDEWMRKNDGPVRSAVQNHVLSAGNIRIDSLQFEGGQMTYKGDFPQSITWAK